MTENKITESAIEKFAIDLLEKQGFEYIYASDVAPDRDIQVTRALTALFVPTPTKDLFMGEKMNSEE